MVIKLTPSQVVALLELIKHYPSYEYLIEHTDLNEWQYHTMKESVSREALYLNDEYCGHCDSHNLIDIREGMTVHQCKRCAMPMKTCSMCVIQDCMSNCPLDIMYKEMEENVSG